MPATTVNSSRLHLLAICSRRTSLTLPNAMQVLYRYDTASRLTKITYLGAVTNRIDYTYDPAGNRSSQASGFSVYNLPSAVPNSLYDVANHQLTFGTYNMLYDLDGNVTSIINATTTNTLLWSARNQLTNMLGAVAATFAYDGVGRRISRTVSSTTEKYAYDGLDTVLQKDSGGSVAARYFRGLSIDEPWQRIDSTSTRDYMADALGSTVAMADTNGVIRGQYAYEPFGATTMTGALTNSYKFTGREDDGTGLYYYRARYYLPALGRFISEDPIGFAGGQIDLYGYVGNDPIRATDRSGLQAPVTAPVTVPGPVGTYPGLPSGFNPFNPGEILGSGLGEFLGPAALAGGLFFGVGYTAVQVGAGETTGPANDVTSVSSPLPPPDSKPDYSQSPKCEPKNDGEDCFLEGTTRDGDCLYWCPKSQERIVVEPDVPGNCSFIKHRPAWPR